MSQTISFDERWHNMHDADVLAEVRDKIKRLKTIEEKLRESLKQPGADLRGDRFEVTIVDRMIHRLDEEKLKLALGDLTDYRTATKTTFVMAQKRR